MPTDPKSRFSDRVEDYRRYRPDYPVALVRLLADRFPPAPGSRVADIGSGTGIFTRQLLEAGYEVVAVEPNEAMRRVAEEDLGSRPGFRQLPGSAEATGLGDHAISLVTVAQAFHWCEAAACRSEFTRILKLGGFVAIVWNERDRECDGFARAYEELLMRLGTDYREVDHTRRGAEKMEILWSGRIPEFHEFPHAQWLDREALHGRVASSSYTPAPGAPGFEELHRELDGLFERFQVAGRIPFTYRTRLYMAPLP